MGLNALEGGYSKQEKGKKGFPKKKKIGIQRYIFHFAIQGVLLYKLTNEILAVIHSKALLSLF